MTITIPTSWTSLSQPQLRQLLKAISSDILDIQTVKTCLLFRWAKVATGDRSRPHRIRLLNFDTATEEAILRIGSEIYAASAQEIYELTSALDWIETIPERPVRPDSISPLRRTISPMLDELTFDRFIALDNLFQGFLKSRDFSILGQMADFLYPPKIRLWPKRSAGSTKRSAGSLLQMAVFYWFAAFKQRCASLYPFLMKPAASDAPSLSFNLRRSVDAQLRALTKGDITKEVTVCSMPCHRALTELDALAREADELRRSLKK